MWKLYFFVLKFVAKSYHQFQSDLLYFEKLEWLLTSSWERSVLGVPSRAKALDRESILLCLKAKFSWLDISKISDFPDLKTLIFCVKKSVLSHIVFKVSYIFLKSISIFWLSHEKIHLRCSFKGSKALD